MVRVLRVLRGQGRAVSRGGWDLTQCSQEEQVDRGPGRRLLPQARMGRGKEGDEWASVHRPVTPASPQQAPGRSPGLSLQGSGVLAPCSGKGRSGWRSRRHPTSSTVCTRASTNMNRSLQGCHASGRASLRSRPAGPSPSLTLPASPPSSQVPPRYAPLSTAPLACTDPQSTPSL